jgi:hypothetical protein
MEQEELQPEIPKGTPGLKTGSEKKQVLPYASKEDRELLTV